ncbi:metal-binding protein ZinT [Sulfitobacter alexandrii]|uniref:Metal-binding protein ZinT n=1 Tax=Sulfitobacter alexandrii TaxID=1917485 RepID=A0A1J0WJ38_9RHOB|nr:metal-binding protein ZinT [Sulfitobacter alexandrii]APE44174.1 metal-binding protein ZinT [Sulfitobacter alexandrii]
MSTIPLRQIAIATVAIFALGTTAVPAEQQAAHGAHTHDHADSAGSIYEGYFEDSQIAPRALTDWEGDWQSVYPLLQDGTLNVVMAHKAAESDNTAEDYRAMYETGYRTDVDRIVIADGSVSFFRDGNETTGRYVTDGFEVLTYEKGNRGVRFVFRKTAGDAAAPAYIQFSDHIIAPQKSGHYHLYWGDDRAALLEELSNWPTYYPAGLSGQQIADEMMAH